MSSLNPRVDSLLAIIRGQAVKLSDVNHDFETLIPQWKARTIRLLSAFLVPDEVKLFDAINTETFGKDRDAYITYLAELESSVRELPEHYLLDDPLPDIPAAKKASKQEQLASQSKNVFIVHGHDTLAKVELARALEKLKLVPIVLHEQPNEGKTVIEKFERDASRVSFAVVLLTPDDIGHPNGKPLDSKPRARQNVILELGYFTGVLGRHRVCVLYKGTVEVPSDYLGVVYVGIDEAGA